MKQSTMSNPKANRTVYLDVMVDGRFYRQLPYSCCPLWPVSEREATEYARKKIPSLEHKRNVRVELSNNRV